MVQERRPRICDNCIGSCGEILGETLAALRGLDLQAFRPSVGDQSYVKQLALIRWGLEAEFKQLGSEGLEKALARFPRMNSLSARTIDECSFCSATRLEVGKLISGPRVFICEGCVLAAASARARGLFRGRYGVVYDELVALFLRHDPVGLNEEDHPADYSPEVEALLPRLESCGSAESVGALLHEVFIDYFDEQIAGPRDVYDRIAVDVWALWETRRNPKSPQA